MAKEPGKTSIIQNKILLMAISVIGALLIWFFVNSAEYVQESNSIPGVKVSFAGRDELREKGFVVTEIQNLEVTVNLTGPRRELSTLNATNLSVSINVTDFTEPLGVMVNENALPITASNIFPSILSTSEDISDVFFESYPIFIIGLVTV